MITSTGFDGTVDYAEWAALTSHMGAQYGVVGKDSFAVSVGVGDRVLNVQPGLAAGQGILDESDAVENLTGAAVASGNRWDLVALRRAWGSSTSTLVLIQGGSAASLPARSTTPGVQDDQPLALVRFSAGQTAAQEIIDLGHAYDEDVDQSGTAAAALHRGWIALKDALTGDDAGSVLGAAVTGENHAVSEYEKALEKDLSAGFRDVVTKQHAAVVAARDEVKALHDAD